MDDLKDIFEWVKTDLEERLLKDLFAGEVEERFNLLYKKGDHNEKTNGSETGRPGLFRSI